MLRFSFLPIAILFGFYGGALAMDIFGHRGASYDAPENTLASVRAAFSQGADGAEVDVHLSRDGQAVVIHDADTARTAGKKLVVKESSFEQLRGLDVGSFKGKAFAGERIPSLAQVLEALPAGKRLIVEIKCGTEILPALEKVLRASGKLSQIVLFGFDRQVVAEAKKLFPAVPALWLAKAESRALGEAPQYQPDLIERARENGLDGLGLHYRGVTEELALAVRRAGLKLYVWTVDDPAEANRLERLGIDALITNRPGWMRQCLRAER